MCSIAKAHVDVRVEPGEVRRVLDKANRAAERARSVQRTLRSAQDFHVVEVLQAQINEQRCVIDIGSDRWLDGRCQRQLASGRLAVEAANDQRAAVHAAKRPLVGKVHTRH